MMHVRIPLIPSLNVQITIHVDLIARMATLQSHHGADIRRNVYACGQRKNVMESVETIRAAPANEQFLGN